MEGIIRTLHKHVVLFEGRSLEMTGGKCVPLRGCLLSLFRNGLGL